MRERLIETIQNSVGGCARHWAEVIADGLIDSGVILPPCKVGDVVYWYNMGGNLTEAQVVREGFTAKIQGGYEYDISYDNIGKTVFLSREDAERALKGGAT